MGMVWEAYWEGGPTFGDPWGNTLSGNHPFSKIIRSKNTWICCKRSAVHNKIHHHFFHHHLQEYFLELLPGILCKSKNIEGSLKERFLKSITIGSQGISELKK